MSKYVLKLSMAIVDALAGVPAAQPAQVASYWANRSFWLAEFEHLVNVGYGYEERVQHMAKAYKDYVAKHGGPYNRDEVGQAYQGVSYTTSQGERKNYVGQARTALKRLADRALDLDIISNAQFDEFHEQLRAIRFD